MLPHRVGLVGGPFHRSSAKLRRGRESPAISSRKIPYDRGELTWRTRATVHEHAEVGRRTVGYLYLAVDARIQLEEDHQQHSERHA